MVLQRFYEMLLTDCGESVESLERGALLAGPPSG